MSDLTWRLILDQQAPGTWNMAVDEVLLEGVASGKAPPTLRFYGWKPACLSLGYFQSFAVVDRDACWALGFDVVRRPTGGRAILHDRELTYSIALPASVLGLDRGILPSYHRISRALQAGFALLGVMTTMAPESAAPTEPEHGPVCFDRPSAHEILLDGRKLVGSAQVRRSDALLQHGSILIEPQISTMLRCLRLPVGVTQSGPGSTQIDDGVIGLAEVGVSDPATIAAAIAEAVGREFNVALVDVGLDARELAAARALSASKYETEEWTERPLAQAAQKTTRTR
jgi:lipoate-protein ligase A